MSDVLDVLTHVQTLAAFVAFLVPGFLSVRAYEAARGGEGRNINDALVDVVIYSFATDAMWVPTLCFALAQPAGSLRNAVVVAIGLLGFVVTPIALGVGWFALQKRLARIGYVSDPLQKPWDRMFARIRERKMDVGLILTLVDGRKFGGRFVDPGSASHYPAHEQVHVGEAWRLDQETGDFLERVDGTEGFIIDKRDILTVEFVDWDVVEPILENARPAG